MKASSRTSRFSAISSVVALVATLVVISPNPPAKGVTLLSWTGTVTNVIDGDTFDVDVAGVGTQTVRVAGINTNEINHTADCWASDAKTRLEQLVLGEVVTLKARDAGSTAEGRPIRHVFLGSTNIGQKMVAEGYGLSLIFINDEPDFADDYISAFWTAHDARLRIHDDDGCASGPQQSTDIELVTIGDADGTDSQNLNGEYVDILNHGGSPLDLTDWAMHDSAIDYYWFPAGTSVPAGGRIRVHVGSGTDSATDLYMGFTRAIFSGMDGAFLLDPDEDIRAFDYWPCHGRCGPPAGRLVVESVIYDPPGNDDLDPNGEQIVIRNEGPTPVNLTDWRVESFPHVLHIDGQTIAPQATATVHVGNGTNGGGKVYWGKSGSILDAPGDSVHLITPDGDVQDCFAWGTNTCTSRPSVSADGSDFDADGFDDLAIGVPGEAIGSISNAGGVNLVWGSPSSTTSTRNRFLRQGGGYPGTAEQNDRFGSSVTAGDFNGDGYPDLAVGAPGETVSGKSNSGAVSAIPGGRYGLNLGDARYYSQWGTVPGSAEAGDLFGGSLAAGDFNGDGFSDLAIGSPGEAIGSAAAAGAVTVLDGSASGLDRNGVLFSQTGPIPGASESDDRFGEALAVGDFNADGYDDLAIGVPGEDLGSKVDAGVVIIVFGSSTGLQTGSAISRSQQGPIPGATEPDDRFASALAAGDLNGDRFDDLIVGVPGEDIGSKTDAGLVTVIPGNGGGLSTGGVSATQDGPIPGGTEPYDLFGAAVAAGDFNRDGFDDVAISAPGEGLSGSANTGAVIMTWSNSGGFNASGSSMFSSSAWGSSTPTGALLGSALMAADFDGDGRHDIAAGSPGATITGHAGAGRTVILEGTDGNGQTGSAWDQGVLAGSPEAGDSLGTSLVNG